MERFIDVIAAFGRPVEFAAAIGIPPSHAGVMKTRDSIPPEYWTRVVEAARVRGLRGITYERLVGIAANKRTSAKRPAKAAAKPSRSRRPAATASIG